MASLPRVSILIPTYNQPQFIRKAIESALMQDYADFEVIVSDDSTGNDTEIIVRDFLGDPRFSYYRNKPALGKADNYRKLLYDYALGEWAVNLDGDDYYTDSSFISVAIEQINAAGPENVLFYMASQIKFSPEASIPLAPKLPAEITVMSGWDYYYKIYSFLHFSHLSSVYNVALAKSSGFYEKKISSSDMNSYFRLCLRNMRKKVILSKRIAGNWVQHGGNESSNYTLKSYLENGKYYFGIFAFALKNNFGNPLKNFWWLIKSLYLYWGSFFKQLLISAK